MPSSVPSPRSSALPPLTGHRQESGRAETGGHTLRNHTTPSPSTNQQRQPSAPPHRDNSDDPAEMERLRKLLRNQSQRLKERVDVATYQSAPPEERSGGLETKGGTSAGPQNRDTVTASVDNGSPPPCDAVVGEDGAVRSGARYYAAPGTRTPSDAAVSSASGHVPATAAAADDDDDSEVRALAKELERREDRMSQRVAELRKQWRSPPVSTGSIMPSQPMVLAAVTEEEVQERALLASAFVNGHDRSHGQADLGTNEGDDDDSFNNNDNYAEREAGSIEGHHEHSVPRERSEQSMRSLGCISMASCSMARITDGAMAVMEMLANRPDVTLPSPAETGVQRQGDVLSSKHILKIDLQDTLRDRRGPTGVIACAPYFRIVPKLNIAGVAQPNVSSIRTIINEFHRSHADGPIIWVNLREEPLVYINGSAHIVRERADPLRPIIIPNVTGRGIESMETKLKLEVLQEASSSGGNISVHVEGKDGVVEDQWESADPSYVFTMSEVFRNIRMMQPSAHQNIEYYRRPITQNVGPQPDDFDFVLEMCVEEPKAVLVFNCQSGRGRSSAMMLIASIVRFYQLCVKDISVDVRVLRGNASTLTFRTIQKLVSLFPDGKLHERRLMILMDMTDKVYSMADHISEAFSGTSEEDAEVAMMRLQLYAYFLVFSYYCEQRLWNYATKLSFSEWLDDNPDLKVLIKGVRDKLADQLREERIVAPEAEGAEAGIARIIRHRRGNVLSSGRILCSVPMLKDGGTVRLLRQLAPDVPIFTCGRVGEQARKELVRDIRAAFPRHQRVQWLSLRAEPMVQINDVNYTLADYNAQGGGAENGTAMHVSLQAMEQIEDRLRRDVLLESQENDGFILLHRLDEEGHRSVMRVKVTSVRTPRSTMDQFAEDCAVIYHRVPMPFSGQMLASDIDPLLSYLAESSANPHDILVINDSEGSTRTTVALNVLTLYRASRLSDLRTIQSTNDFAEILRANTTGKLIPGAHMASTVPVSTDEVPDQPIELLLASTICQMLTAGTLLRTVDAAIALGGRGKRWNILHTLDCLKKRIATAGSNKPQCVLDALHGLRCYLLVLLTSLYLDDQGGGTGEPFSRWVEERSEVCNIIDTIDARGEASLKYISSDNLMKADLSRRSGDVLTANFCIKADHFPGCQKHGLRPVVCGAPNFRKVDMVNVFGVAIPTLLGVHNIISLLGASTVPMRTYPGEVNDLELFRGFAGPRLFDPTFKAEELQRPLRGSVVWVNLREEPIVYVGDKPCVFRDLERPYVNVELTGIQTEKIEQVEVQLKNDILNEAAQYDGKFLIHDEGNPGELVGAWEPANEDTVKTVRDVYAELAVNGCRCQFIRQPVTDEQSPDINDFDALVGVLLPRIAKHLDRRETLSFVFNCQMGRGRTTTGMVICCLLIGLVIPEYYDELHSVYNPLYKEEESELSRGDYQVITQLKRVLSNGRQSKYKVDLVMQACSRMQNLRTAIESYALLAGSPDTTEEGRARAHHAGVHYLVRYFNIVVFASYLEEFYDRTHKRMTCTFVEWMAAHPELTSLRATSALK